MNKLVLKLFIVAIFFFIFQSLSAQNPGSGNVAHFPESNYTPFGYLDNPYHTFVLNRSGVIRSVPPLGFGFWCRRMPWPYGAGAQREINYLSFLHLSLFQDGTRFHSAEDFNENQVELISKYHSKNMMSYDWQYKDLTYSAQYLHPVEHAIVCILEITNNSKVEKNTTLHATNIYGYPEREWWGSNGMVSIHNTEIDAAVSKIWAYGDVFALGADIKSVGFKATSDEEQWNRWITENNLSSNEGTSVRIPGPLYSVQSYEISIEPKKSKTVIFSLSRGKTEMSVSELHNKMLSNGNKLLTEKINEDNTFYNKVPLLQGDWPAEWRHGWIYDWETLRMNIRSPVGIYKHHWDGMQIFSPRSVLGETAIDAMCMSYADVAVAKDMLLGVFADALMPNIPCSREDGSVNMIAADGRECGTAPIWGVPFHVINSIYQRDKDDKWLTELYPHLKNFLNWWLENRTDDDGWFHAANSWESGQDGSKRFLIPNHDPGAAADFVRTVDIEAAMAHAMLTMQSFAVIADKPHDVDYWASQTKSRIESTRSMFVDGWFRDFDARTGKPIILDNYYDIMMFLPATLNIASPGQMQELHPMFYHFRNNPRHFMEWPSFLFPFTEAAWNAGLKMFNAEEVVKIGNRIYPRLDERNLQPVLIRKYENWLPEKYSFRIPGVSDEFWPINTDNPGGCENYGWGATYPTLIIRNIIGFRDTPNPADNAFLLAPSLPDDFFKNGKVYGMKNLRYRQTRFDVTYSKKNSEDIDIILTLLSDDSISYSAMNEQGKIIASSEKENGKTILNFTGKNGDVYTLSVN